MANPLQSNVGSFIGTTNVWDVQKIKSVDVNSDEFKELLVRLYQNVNNIVLALNIKDVGYYSIPEFLNGQLFFPNPTLSISNAQSHAYRQVFRTVVNFGALPNAGAKSVAHNIDINTALPSNFSFTRIYGAASNGTSQTSFIPLPFSSPTLNQNIKLTVDNVNVNITTAIDYSSYVTTYVIVEYIKN
jgi:hypothetical protein